MEQGRAAHVSSDAFFQALPVLWEYLGPRTQAKKDIRATCSRARLQHDRLLSHLPITLGRSHRLGSKGAKEMPPPPEELGALLRAVVGRGAPLQSLTVRFERTADRQRTEAELLAVLDACSPCHVSRLELRGAVPHSRATAKAVQACCPHLTSLDLDHKASSHPEVEVFPPREAAAGYHDGCVQLLTLCGPRLTELRLHGVHHWQPPSYMAVRHCTALMRLDLKALYGHDRSGDDDDIDSAAEPPALDLHVFSAVEHLETLRSLSMTIDMDTDDCDPRALVPVATSVVRLSALTALTSLHMHLSECYEHCGNSWNSAEHEGTEHDALNEVREAHLASLVPALRNLQQLQHLSCPSQWLRPEDVAQLSAATSLTLGGLLPPAATPPQGASGWPLPPQLRQLNLKGAVSPRALAALQPPQSLVNLEATTLRFGISDVTPVVGRLTPEAVEAVGPAVRLLVDHRDPARGMERIRIEADGSPMRLLPRDGSRDGHMEWIRQLRGLDAFGRLQLSLVMLSTADLVCLGSTLPDLRGLSLADCSFPLAALPGMRFPMLHLTHMALDLQACGPVDDQVLEPLLLLLCRPHGGATPLEYLACKHVPRRVDGRECRRAVLEQLEVAFGVTGVTVWVTPHSDCPGSFLV